MLNSTDEQELLVLEPRDMVELHRDNLADNEEVNISAGEEYEKDEESAEDDAEGGAAGGAASKAGSSKKKAAVPWTGPLELIFMKAVLLKLDYIYPQYGSGLVKQNCIKKGFKDIENIMLEEGGELFVVFWCGASVFRSMLL